MKKKSLISLILIMILVTALVILSLTIRSDKVGRMLDEDGNLLTAEEVAEYEANGMADSLTEVDSDYFGTFMALVPPLVAIFLALITKEVYSSLFAGVLTGALLATNFSPAKTLDVLIDDGLISAVSGNAGIFIFLVELGILVALINRSGAARAFGKWAEKNIKTKLGALLATFALGVLIFIDDYFNCLTVGSVMAPVTDSKKISRVKLAFIIDATAAPICMIAPISSWAAAVSSTASDCGLSGLELFLKAIPFNFYSLLTLVFIIAIALLGFDYGSMAGFEIKAQNGDLSKLSDKEEPTDTSSGSNGILIDMLVPVIFLIVISVIALIYWGGFFDAESSNYLDLINAFGDTDSTVALPWAGLVALIVSFIYLIARKTMNFTIATKMIPNGFYAMVPAILILTFANALKNTTNILGSKVFVGEIMENAEGLQAFLPAIIFVIACILAFSTGTSWGTFGILIPVVLAAFGSDTSNSLLYIGISACLAGAVCGDHCSPISDTTIMASAGAGCNHVDHVSTQLPYAITVAAVSFVSFIIAGLIQNWFICFPISVVLMVGTLLVIKKRQQAKQ